MRRHSALRDQIGGSASYRCSRTRCEGCECRAAKRSERRAEGGEGCECSAGVSGLRAPKSAIVREGAYRGVEEMALVAIGRARRVRACILGCLSIRLLD
jgi:hypothetical protein